MPTKSEDTKAAKEAKGTYTEGVGRRKSAIARVRVRTGTGAWKINGRTLAEYFPTEEWRKNAEAPLAAAGIGKGMTVEAHIRGGGVSAQSDALRHGLARALVKIDPDTRKALKAHGYLKRDPRVVERKKFGLKKARKSPKWSKR